MTPEQEMRMLVISKQVTDVLLDAMKSYCAPKEPNVHDVLELTAHIVCTAIECYSAAATGLKLELPAPMPVLFMETFLPVLSKRFPDIIQRLDSANNEEPTLH